MNIDTSELTNYHRKFNSIFTGEQRIEILTIVGKKMGVAAESIVSEYPPPSKKPLPYFYTRDTVAGKKVRPFKSKFKSDKQAYYVVFILGKEGKIPYSRTGTLAKSITSKIDQVTANSVTTSIGSNLSYAPYVIGNADEQSNYHKGTWATLEQDVNKGAEKIAKVAHSTYTAEVTKRLSV